jgi:RHS repeat-associated protein
VKNGSESGLRSAVSYRFGFNGKENDNEVKGTGNSVDFGARIYDSRLGRWLSLDPYSKKYPDLSPYVGFENSPTSIVDPGGDTTVYYSSSGKLLHFSYDKLPTAVVLVSDNDIKRFNMQFSLVKKAGTENDNTANNRLRKFGLNIMIDEYRKFYKNHTVPGKHDKGNVNRFNEYKVNLYIKDNKLIIGSKVITSNDPGVVVGNPDVEKDKGTLAGDAHTHPNEGLPVESGSWEYGPSSTDMTNSDDYNIVVGREQIYIFGKKLSVIITIDKKTLQKGHRDRER